MASCMVQTRSSSSSIKDDVDSKQSDSQVTPVPDNLYTYIEQALVLEKQLETNISDKDLESKLSYVLHRMGIIARFHKANNDLPSDWEYNSDTARHCVSAPNPTFKMKNITKRRRRPNPHNDSAPFTNQKVWREFKDGDEATKIKGLPCPIAEEIKNPLGTKDEFVRLICDFAVRVFNDSYQMYVNKDNAKNVSNARIMACFYLKVDWYIFYMTIEAIEQGNPGVYEITVRCNIEDGAITLDSFVLKYDKYSGTRKGTKFSQGSTYENVQDGWTSPEVYYESSGMVRRSHSCGGYNYANPYGTNSWLQ